MTTRIAMVLACLILLGAGADLIWDGGEGLRFLARKLLDLVEYLSFWR